MLGDKLSCVWSSYPLNVSVCTCIYICTCIHAHMCVTGNVSSAICIFPRRVVAIFIYYLYIIPYSTPISLDLWSVFSGEELKCLAIEDTEKATPHYTFHDIIARRGILKLD